MVKFAISFFAIFFAHSASLESSQLPLLSSYSEESRAALTNFKTEVKFLINEAQIVITEHKGLLKTLHNSAMSLQKEVSDTINSTMTGFSNDLNRLFTDASHDISQCVGLSSIVESTAMDILIDTNTCIHNKLYNAEVYIERSILSVEQISARLDSLQDIADEIFSKAMKNKQMKTILKTKLFLKSVSAEPSQVAAEIISTLTDTALVISQINSLMISNCISTEAMSSLIDDVQLVYSKIKTCVADLNSSNADLLVNDYVVMLGSV